MSAALVGAVVSRLAGTNLAGGAHDSRPTAATYPYVIVYADGGIRSSDREADARIEKTVSFQTTTVGSSAAQARAALDRVNDALEDWAPTVAGWSCTRMEHEGAQAIKPDEELTDRTVYYATDQWSFVADPA